MRLRKKLSALLVGAFAGLAGPASAGSAPEMGRAEVASAEVGSAEVEVVNWGQFADPAPGPAAVFGGHARGCLAGAQALPLQGDGFQVMRPSRNRFYGHPELIRFVREFAEAMDAQGWSGLLIGDLAQPRGGPMTSGHRSHQTGLDADIWFVPAPPRQLSPDERETLSAVSMLNGAGDDVDPDRWTEGHARLLRTAAGFTSVDRIFVNAAIKRALCRSEAGDRDWLGKIRPWWGHDHHFHVGLRCAAGDPLCADRQPPVPPGDGCDDTLAWWFSAEARAEAASAAPRPPLTLDDLPGACRGLLGS